MKKHLLFIIGLVVAISFCWVSIGGIVMAEETESNKQKIVGFTDVEEDFWAKPAIDRWSDHGVVKGDGERFYPNKVITRAEMMTILAGVFGLENTADNPFDDIAAGEWYYSSILKAYAAGIMQGDFDAKGKQVARPNDPITRAEAAVLFKQLFSIEGNAGANSQFQDKNLPDWAKESIFGMEAAGYMQGKGNGMFDPSGYLTRAEAVQILNKVIAIYIDRPGSYSEDVVGNVVVNARGILLQNMKINGNLYLAEGSSQGANRLENVTVIGKTFVRIKGIDELEVTDCNLGTIVQAGFVTDEVNTETEAEIPSKPVDGASGGGGSGDSGGGGESGGSDDPNHDDELDGGNIADY